MSPSMLVYRDVADDANPTVATLVGLHGRGGDLDQLTPLCSLAAKSFHLVTPQAARPITPESQGYTAESEGYTWYFIQEAGRPEPATFGESLAELEEFIREVKERHGMEKPLFLLGFDQGAVLALTLAAVIPEFLSGVVAICGYVPEFRGWSPPAQNVQALPVMVVHDPQDPAAVCALVEKSVKELRNGAAVVDLREVPGVRADLGRATTLLQRWLSTKLGGESERSLSDSETRQREGTHSAL